MKSRAVTVGKRYACQTPIGSRDSPVEVRVIGMDGGGRVQIEHLEGPLRGRREIVHSRNLICRWKDLPDCIRDEEHRETLREISMEALNLPESRAISCVLAVAGADSGFSLTWDLAPAQADELWSLADLPGSPLDEPHAYIDRKGTLHLSYLSALRFARAYAHAQPKACLEAIGTLERDLRQHGYLPGRPHVHSLLQAFEPSFALVRSWAAHPEPETELQRVHHAIEHAVKLLRDAGLERQARIVEKELSC